MTTGASVFSLDKRAIERAERLFREKRRLAGEREEALFGIFQGELTEEEAWALKLLYADMPLHDMADYDGELFLSHVRETLRIRREMPWGSRVPDDLFVHYVLPYRINSENIEDCRGILFEELEERVRGLSMADAILETNYWSYEKATYIGSDLRTLSPLSVIRNARGRCGEESTLTVAALRSLCIPARQVYTPRWAHSDSNHAWVEAWADGHWHYIGACEPEPRLDQGWFSRPAARAMLIHARVPAGYGGPEPVIAEKGGYAELNLTAGYADTRTVSVFVKKADGSPSAGTEVSFQLYNYAQLSTIVTLSTDERGYVSFETSRGDLYIHAASEGRWGELRAGAEDGDAHELALDRISQPEGTYDFDMAPPPEPALADAGEALAEEERRRHEKRVEEGALIRSAYEGTFIREEEAKELAGRLGLPPERVWSVLQGARGNGAEIAAFLEERSAEYCKWPLRLLESLNKKDLVDTFRDTLDDHLIHSFAVRGELSEELFRAYVLNPRVAYEMITPYKREIQQRLAGRAEAFRADPSAICRWLQSEWAVRDELALLEGKATPLGTFRLKSGDFASVQILFVALCRSIGVPARLHPSERKPQYWADDRWLDAPLAAKPSQGPTAPAATGTPGTLLLVRDPEAGEEAAAPDYAGNFTIARLENGSYKTLAYRHGQDDILDAPLEVEEGEYRLTTGTRLKDGTALVRFAYFRIRGGERTEMPVTFRLAPLELPLLGLADASACFETEDGSLRTLGELTGAEAAVLAWLEPEREPSKHLLRELAELAPDYEASGVRVLLAVAAADGKQLAALDGQARSQLPSGTILLLDRNGAALSRIRETLPPDNGEHPVAFVLDGGLGIRYRQEGYKLGTGKEALQAGAALRGRSEREEGSR